MFFGRLHRRMELLAGNVGTKAGIGGRLRGRGGCGNRLRQPLLDPDQALNVQVSGGLFGFGKGLRLQSGDIKVRVGTTPGGYSWRFYGAGWKLQHITNNGNCVLFRNGQPLAAVQYQGRQIDMWSEFIYAGMGYRLDAVGKAGEFHLLDENGQEIMQFLCQTGLEIKLQRPAPLTLLLLAALRLLDEKKAAG